MNKKTIIVVLLMVGLCVLSNAQTDSKGSRNSRNDFYVSNNSPNTRSNNVPNLIPFQGRLTDAGGNSVNETVNITFSLYDVETGGSALWSETQSVSVTEGLFKVTLGNITPLDEDNFSSANRWIGISVGTDSEMSPRARISAVPYALQSGTSTPDNDWTIDGDDVYHETGNVGIGTTNPDTDLTIYSDTDYQGLTLQTSDNSFNQGIRFRNSAGAYIWNIYRKNVGSNNADLVFANGIDADISSLTDRITLKTDGTINATAYTGDGSALTGIDGDNLGNHAATQNIKLNGYRLSGDGDDEGIFVDSNGNVGIGTANPTSKLTILGGDIEVRETDDENTAVKINAGGTSGQIHLYHEGTEAIKFHANPINASYINAGNIGIGTTTPDEKLSVIGTVRASNDIGETEYVEIVHGGANAVLNWNGDGNLNFRYNNSILATLNQAGDFNIPSTQGYQIGGNKIISIAGTGNTFVGKLNGAANTDGSFNSFFGNKAGKLNSTGNANAFFGEECGENNTEGIQNNFFGSQSGENNTTGSNNTYLGDRAGRYNETGLRNVFIGKSAGLNEMGSYRLYIASSSTTSPLIWGDFENSRLVVNGNNTHNTGDLTFFVNGSAGGNTVWSNASDRNLKKNISTISNPLEKIQKLRGVNFEWKDPEHYEDGTQMGFIAQEAEEIIPEVVTKENGKYRMSYSPITALLVEAIKEQQKMIEQQQQQIDELKKIIKK